MKLKKSEQCPRCKRWVKELEQGDYQRICWSCRATEDDEAMFHAELIGGNS